MKKKKAGWRHEGRNDLAGEHPFGDAGQIILFFLFLAVWIFDSFVFKYSTQILKIIPLYIHLPAAIIIFILSGILAKVSLGIVFGERRDPPEVITKSVFAWVRHPVYLAALLLYWGLMLSTLSIFSFAFWIIIFLFYNYIAAHEEKKLAVLFGDDYKEYMKNVPRWIPRYLFRR